MFVFRSITALIALVALLGLGSACASGGSSSGGSSAPAEAKAEIPIPAGSPLAKVEPGMSDEQVRSVAGSPDNSNAYMTGKAFIPFYYGPDTHRTDWLYKGQGRVVFSRNRYSGGLKVIRVIYNPDDAL